MGKSRMVEKSWEYYRKREGKNKWKQWRKISKQLILENGFWCSESLCNTTPEFEFEKDIWVEEREGKLIVRGECRICQGQFGQFESLELPQEFTQFARYYFFGENPNIQEEISQKTQLVFKTDSNFYYQ